MPLTRTAKSGVSLRSTLLFLPVMADVGKNIMTTQWRDLLVQERISEEVINELEGQVNYETLARLRTISCKSKDDVAYLSKIIAGMRKCASKETFEKLADELHEIQKDFKWIGTKRGRYVLTINSWAQSFYDQFRSNVKFNDIIIGGHSDAEVVFATGVVPTRKAFIELLAYIQSKKPPYKIMTDIHIGKWSGPKAEIAK